MLETLVYACAAGVCCAALTLAWSTIRYHSPPVPSTRNMHRAVIEMINTAQAHGSGQIKPDAEVAHAGVIYELGAGWGGLACSLARTFPDKKVVAIEVSVLPVLICYIQSLRVQNLTVMWSDARHVSFGENDIIVTYVTAPVMQALSPIVPQSSTWISIFFQVPQRSPRYRVQLNDSWQTKVYGYVS